MSHSQPLRLVFFGGSEFSVIVFEELRARGFVPRLVVTDPAKRRGREAAAAPSVVKQWADTHSIPTLETPTLKDPAVILALASEPADMFIVASYGHIIPKNILDLPEKGTINVHPSLLPKLRGASPLQTAILEDIRETGVSIMLIDEEMDHGPILAEEKVNIQNWPPTMPELETILGKAGGALLAETLPKWANDTITSTVQNHTEATYTKKFAKEDGLIDLSADPYLNFRKIQAFARSPKSYFFIKKADKDIRVTINKAEYKDGVLTLLRVTPEGKQEMDYKDFAKGYL